MRDEDIGKRLYRPVKIHDRDGDPVDVSPAKIWKIIEMIDMCPESWGPRLIYEEIRNAGRHDISEQLVRITMSAMRTNEMPILDRPE
ncbi:hypothetical protein [Frankia sp. AvcI1]|uniref:hypothetical protein n=1 Tax=Frankia sp. AvcI1 TaxID=573496 RepID=UPI00138F5C00|nr:hypothetical protein [Frankia sp. AvcI1]